MVKKPKTRQKQEEKKNLKQDRNRRTERSDHLYTTRTVATKRCRQQQKTALFGARFYCSATTSQQWQKTAKVAAFRFFRRQQQIHN